MQRTCTDCHKTFELVKENFHPVKTVRFGGFQYRCRGCDKAKRSTPEYYKKWNARHGKAAVERAIQWKKKYPEKELAQRQLQKAVRLGIIKRMPCVECKNPKAMAHHPDYSKPLDVVWMCASHHRKLHYSLSHPLK